MRQIQYLMTISLVLLMQSVHAQSVGDNSSTRSTTNDYNTATTLSSGYVPTSPIDGQITIQTNYTLTAGVYIFLSSIQRQIDAGIIFTENGIVMIREGELTTSATYQGALVDGSDVLPVNVVLPAEWSCGDTLVYGGQSYATIQIGGQCWMAENLNIGTMINGTTSMSDNGTIEKYCFDNDPAACATYGGLYQWEEMMQYTTVEGTQGVCPTGWHLPSDAEWMTLEDSLGMSSGTGLESSGATGWRGTDQGSQLAGNESLWYDGDLDQNIAFDTSGIHVLPAGFSNVAGTFGNQSYDAFFWTSSESGASAWGRYLFYNSPQILRNSFSKSLGFSVRCVQD